MPSLHLNVAILSKTVVDAIWLAINKLSGVLPKKFVCEILFTFKNLLNNSRILASICFLNKGFVLIKLPILTVYSLFGSELNDVKVGSFGYNNAKTVGCAFLRSYSVILLPIIVLETLLFISLVNSIILPLNLFILLKEYINH